MDSEARVVWILQCTGGILGMSYLLMYSNDISVMDLELRKVKAMLTHYNVWPTDSITITLRTKIDKLQHTKASLAASRGVNFDLGLATFVVCTFMPICLYSHHFHPFLFYICIIFSLLCLMSLPSNSIDGPLAWISPLQGVTLIIIYSACCMHILDGQLLTAPV